MAMSEAPVGDDVFGEDPSVQERQSRCAALMGHEAALFCPSGTMTNQIAIQVHTQPGDEVICDRLSHIYNYEGGGVAFNSGVQIRTAGDKYGRISAEEVESLIQPEIDIHAAQTRLIVVENTSNKGGGTCLGLPLLRKISNISKKYGINYHLDGARLFNAMVRDNETPNQYDFFDSISICLSKGLGAPIGSLLLSNKDFIEQGRRVRKRLGGGMRQSGYLAAAGIYALKNNINRLGQDHLLAQKINDLLKELDYIAEIKPVQSNIILFRVIKSVNPSDLFNHLQKNGVYIILMDKEWMRIVTHLDISKKHFQMLSGSLYSFSSKI